MPRDQQPQEREQKSWAEWKAELHEAIEELDKACAHARQVIYRLRPLVRPKGQTKAREEPEEETSSERPVALNRRQQARRER